eukprot:sb/3468667/
MCMINQIFCLSPCTNYCVILNDWDWYIANCVKTMASFIFKFWDMVKLSCSNFLPVLQQNSMFLNESIAKKPPPTLQRTHEFCCKTGRQLLQLSFIMSQNLKSKDAKVFTQFAIYQSQSFKITQQGCRDPIKLIEDLETLYLSSNTDVLSTPSTSEFEEANLWSASQLHKELKSSKGKNKTPSTATSNYELQEIMNTAWSNNTSMGGGPPPPGQDQASVMRSKTYTNTNRYSNRDYLSPSDLIILSPSAHSPL